MKKLFAMMLLALLVSVSSAHVHAEGMMMDESFLNDMPEDEYNEGDMPPADWGDAENVDRLIDDSRSQTGREDSRNPDFEW